MRSKRHGKRSAPSVVAWLPVVVASCAFVLVAADGPRVATPSARADSRPNVVVIEVDDMRADELPLLTKTVDALSGATFDRSEVATSLCCPSRAAFLSGQYSQNNHVDTNNDGFQLDRTDTLNTWLHDGGYNTAFLGKYLNGYACGKPTPPGWDDWQGLCGNIYGMFNYTLQDNGSRVKYGTSAADYQTDVLADRASATLARQAATGRPFFTWITPTAPHSGPGQRVASRYANSLLTWMPPSSPSVGEANVTDKPAWIQQLKPITGAQRKALYINERMRARMLLAVDDLVERTVATLRDTGQLDRTVIVFTSDNGFLRGEHRIRTGKEVAYRESLTVPLLMSGPGIVERHVPDLVGNIDLAPTIADLAGVAPRHTTDGRSLVPLLHDSGTLPPRVLVHHIVPDNTADGLTGRHPSGDAVSTQRFKYVKLSTGETELYDSAIDPYEMANVSGFPKYEPIEAALASILASGVHCAGRECDIALPNVAPTPLASVRCTVYFECAFDATPSTDIDGTINQYAWDFGDGSTGSGATVAHTYDTTGAFTATLTITDDAGGTRSTTLLASGVANVAPTAIAEASCTDLGCDFSAVRSADPDGYLVTYRWTFGDGKAAVMPSPSHAYLVGGDYTATLSVTDNRGATSRATVAVHVSAPNIAPTASASYNCTDLTCAFDGSTSFDPDGTVVNWTWDFGDGETVSGATPSHAYAVSGVYSVNLTVTDDTGALSTIPAMLDVTVTDPVIPESP